MPNLSEKTDDMRPRKGSKTEWTEKRNTDFNNLHKELTTQLCLAQNNDNKENIVQRMLARPDSKSTMAKGNQRRLEINCVCQPIFK